MKISGVPNQQQAAREWQCGQCGAWVSTGWWRHAHTEDTTPSVEELIEARKRGEDATGYTAKVTVYMRTGKEPTREAPLG